MDILYEEIESTNIKYTSFISANDRRYDLAIIQTNHFYGKHLIINIQSGRTAIVGKDDLEEPGFLESAYNLSEEEAEDLYDYLSSYIQ